MYIHEQESRRRQKEAESARENRAEIVRALSHGQVTRRELVRWGGFTAAGLLAAKNGLSPFARSAFAAVPTGVPRSPLFGAQKFTQPLHRLDVQAPVSLTRNELGHAAFPSDSPEPAAKRLSYHTDYSAVTGGDAAFRNPLTGRGPMEGRPPGEFFAHQRWDEYFPKVGYVLSMGQCESGTYYHELMPAQDANSVWTFGRGRFARGHAVPPLIKARYGEPILTRIYNNLPIDRHENNGFGRNEISTHFHNAHNGAESDGASNAFHFPGTFYDYRWGTTLARRDKINTAASEPRASGPDGNGGLIKGPGDFREIQGSMWFHDHRFFFTAENVYKGNFGAINMYSGPDRGNEELDDGVNLRLPSGYLLDWGNIDFDVNLIVHDVATRQDGQLFFDIFNMDGFLGDIICVNNTYAPYFEVLPRKYRFRLLNACMSRFLQIAIADSRGRAVPFKFIANDGNFVTSPISLQTLDQQGVGERYDIVVDFSSFKPGDRIRLVNVLKFKTGEKPDERLSLGSALRGDRDDPAVGAFLEFVVKSSVSSVDVPGVTHFATRNDRSRVPSALTEQIPIVTPVRTRTVEFKKEELNPATNCTPSCEEKDLLPWVIRVDGESTHSLNANRISLLVPKPGEVEHWVLSTGGGWDHPVHLHFEEAVRQGGTVKFQVQFGEFGGSYVNHCHNTVHEDFAMLMRYQVLGNAGTPQLAVTPTPIPTEDGVTYRTPEILPEADPRRRRSS